MSVINILYENVFQNPQIFGHFSQAFYFSSPEIVRHGIIFQFYGVFKRQTS
jgi:hypothetical protein